MRSYTINREVLLEVFNLAPLNELMAEVMLELSSSSLHTCPWP